MEKGVSIKDIALKFDIPLNSLSTIIKKNRDMLQNDDSSNSCSKCLRTCVYEDVDEVVLKLIHTDEAGLFPLIAKRGTDRRGKILFVSLIAGKEFRKWVVRNSDPFFPGYSDIQKRHGYIVLSSSHDLMMTTRSRTCNMSLDRFPPWAAD
ncbi:hypothetical protein TNCV_5047921 [Trichonephila clavipes]|nr:hypothetical protein TNCV_5047921 [Trichonephila clavipes]